MPLVCSQDWSGIPGIVVAAPHVEYLQEAYAEQVIEEQWNIVLRSESRDITGPWAWHLAKISYKTPWWMVV